MDIEIKLFRLTKTLYAFYMTEEAVKAHLTSILGEYDYWDGWIERYHQLNESRESQVLLLHRMGASYRDIQHLMRISPNTIQMIINDYDLQLVPLYGTDMLEINMTRLENRLRKEGILLW